MRSLSQSPTGTLDPERILGYVRGHALRRPGANGEIKLALHGVPELVTVAAPSIPANQSDSTITHTAASGASPAERTIVVIGHLDQATQPALAESVTIIR